MRILLTLSAVLLSTSTALAADAGKGKTTFDTLCASCHGATGAGDGAIAASFPPDQKPRNLQDTASYKFAKDDAKFHELLKKGGAGVGLSPLMPPQMSLTDADIDDLLAYVKTLKK